MNNSEFEAFFKQFPVDTLQKISADLSLEVLSKKSELTEGLKNYAISYGVKTLGSNVKVEVLKGLAEDLKLEGEKGKPVTARNAIIKALDTKVLSGGVDEVFKSVKKDHLEAILDFIEVDKESSQKALASQVSDELRRTGVDILLFRLKISILHVICEELKIEVLPTTSRKIIVESIVEGEVPDTKPRKVEKLSKKKPSLEKGVSVENIVYHYGKTELEEFINKHKLTATGKKRDLAKKIVEYLEDEVEKSKKEKDTPKKEKDTPKKEKDTPKKEKDTPKKEKDTPKKEKDTPKKDKDTPKKDKDTPKKDKDTAKKDDEKDKKQLRKVKRHIRGMQEKQTGNLRKHLPVPKRLLKRESEKQRRKQISRSHQRNPKLMLVPTNRSRVLYLLLRANLRATLTLLLSVKLRNWVAKLKA